MNASNIATDLVIACAWNTVGTALECLNCHMYIVFVMVFTLVGRLRPDNDTVVSLYPAFG